MTITVGSWLESAALLAVVGPVAVVVIYVAVRLYGTVIYDRFGICPRCKRPYHHIDTGPEWDRHRSWWCGTCGAEGTAPPA